MCKSPRLKRKMAIKFSKTVAQSQLCGIIECEELKKGVRPLLRRAVGRMHFPRRQPLYILLTDAKEDLAMDRNEFKKAEGSCIISEDVIASIACTAAGEVAGVAGMAGRTNDLRGIISPSAAARSVRVENNENGTVLDVYLKLVQGAHIQDVATQVQQSVKVAVQSMTGRPVTRVNVHIEGMVGDEAEA